MLWYGLLQTQFNHIRWTLSYYSHLRSIRLFLLMMTRVSSTSADQHQSQCGSIHHERLPRSQSVPSSPQKRRRMSGSHSGPPRITHQHVSPHCSMGADASSFFPNTVPFAIETQDSFISQTPPLNFGESAKGEVKETHGERKAPASSIQEIRQAAATRLRFRSSPSRPPKIPGDTAIKLSHSGRVAASNFLETTNGDTDPSMESGNACLKPPEDIAKQFRARWKGFTSRSSESPGGDPDRNRKARQAYHFCTRPTSSIVANKLREEPLLSTPTIDGGALDSNDLSDSVDRGAEKTSIFRQIPSSQRATSGGPKRCSKCECFFCALERRVLVLHRSIPFTSHPEI